MNRTKISAFLATILSLICAHAYGAIDASRPTERLAEAEWPELRDKLVNMRMPQSYYDFLSQQGVRNLNELYREDANDGLKKDIMEMYKQDLMIMANSDKTRSFY